MFHVKHYENISDEERWQAMLVKDRHFDGAFVTGVHSTGIYCCPSCPARTPLRKNVRFYATPSDAKGAGLRPCKCCSPVTQSAEEASVLAAIAAIRATVEAGQGAMTLEALCDLTGYAPTHFQLLFKRTVGISPATFARALRKERLQVAFGRGLNVT